MITATVKAGNASLFASEIEQCKTTGETLHIPAGQYDGDLFVANACLTWDPPAAGKGRSFSIIAEGAVINGQITLDSCDHVQIMGLHGMENIELRSCKHIRISKCTLRRSVILSHGTYWCLIESCGAGSAILYSPESGTGINANTFLASTFNNGYHYRYYPGNPTPGYDNHECSIYVEANECSHNVFVGCDTSYAKYPIYREWLPSNHMNDPLVLLGHFHEVSTGVQYPQYDCFASNKNIPDSMVASIIAGSDYAPRTPIGTPPAAEASANQIGLRARGFSLTCRQDPDYPGWSAGHILVPDFAAALYISSSFPGGKPIAEFVNRYQTPENRSEFCLRDSDGTPAFYVDSTGRVTLRARTRPDTPQEGDMYWDQNLHSLVVFDESKLGIVQVKDVPGVRMHGPSADE